MANFEVRKYDTLDGPAIEFKSRSVDLDFASGTLDGVAEYSGYLTNFELNEEECRALWETMSAYFEAEDAKK